MAKKTKAADLSIEEKLEQALVVPGYEPYKIPDNWCWVSLDSLGRFGMGQTILSKDLVDNGIPVYSATEEDRIFGFIYSNDNLIKLSTNDIVIPARGNSIGYVKLISEKEATCTQTTMFYKPINKEISKYIYYYMKSRKDDLFAYHGNAIPQITINKVSKKAVALAPMIEQHRIVERIESLFSKLDEAKEKAQEVIDSFETRKAAILHKAFTGELTAKWREKNECESWENIPLAEFATIVSGFAFSSNDFNKQNGVPCVKITNVGVGEYYADEYEYLPDAYLNEYPQFVVNYGDVLISLTRSYINTGLKVCIYLEPKKALLNQRVALIKNCNTQYLYYYLCSNSVLTYIKEKSKTTNQPNLSIKDLRNLIIPVASSEEQQIIVEELDSLLSKEIISKQAAEALIDQIDIMKKSILSRAFRGELGTNDPEEESAVELLKQILSGE